MHWADLVVSRWSNVDFSPVASCGGDHCIPAMLAYVFLSITHVSHTCIFWNALGYIWLLCGGHVDFTPVAPPSRDHHIPAMLTQVFLYITHVSCIYRDVLG